MSADYRDLAIELLADENLTLRERLASVEADRDVYRELAQQGIHTAHHQRTTIDRLRGHYRRLLDEYRALREHLLRAAA